MLRQPWSSPAAHLNYCTVREMHKWVETLFEVVLSCHISIRMSFHQIFMYEKFIWSSSDIVCKSRNYFMNTLESIFWLSLWILSQAETTITVLALTKLINFMKWPFFHRKLRTFHSGSLCANIFWTLDSQSKWQYDEIVWHVGIQLTKFPDNKAILWTSWAKLAVKNWPY